MGPAPTAPPADDQNVNPGQSFPCKLAGERRKWAYFGHCSNFISEARFFPPAPPAPLDAAQQRRRNLIDLAGLLNACAESRRLEGLKLEDFTTYRSLRLKLKFKFIKLLSQVQSFFYFKPALCEATLHRGVEAVPDGLVVQVIDAHLRA